MPTPDEMEQLELTAGMPVMILHRRTSAGRVVEFARGVHTASRLAWSYTFTIPE
jgi:GntR family transcriptional regulator